MTAPATAVGQGVCDRTPQVRDALVEVTGVSTCEEVTSEHLAGVRFLDLQWTHTNTLQAHDFSGLSRLSHLVLRNNLLTTLPAGIFSGLSSLQYLLLEHNYLTALPEGVFSGLSSLRRLDLFGNSLTILPVGIFSGLSSLNWLRLDKNSLTTLPVGVFDGLSSLGGLVLADNSLTTLPVGIFRGMSNLSILFLRYNSLTTLPVGVFDGLGFLKRLYLEHNSLTALPKGVFSGMNSLLHLELQHNSLTTMPGGGFNGLSNLQLLRLDNNSLTTLTEGVFSGLSSLQYLHLEHNSLTALTEGVFSGPSYLQYLYLEHNSLTTLPETIFSQTSYLSGLFLQSNSLTTLPEEIFSGLSSLTRLKLDTNSLTVLPEGIFSGLSSLRELTLNDNSLTTLPEGIFGELSNLNRLELHSNSLLMLPEEIFSGLSSLHHLHLSKYSLTTLPMGAFSELDSLFSLTLSGNSLNSLPVGVFNGLSNLAVLKLSGNSLTSLPAGVFNGLSSLVELTLSNNSLTNLPQGIFEGLSSLIWLRLDNNSLTTLPAGVFNGLSSLLYLYLEHNSLTTLSAGVFRGLSSLLTLTLHNNGLATLPVHIFTELDRLFHLELNNNSLTTLPAGVFSGLKRLRLLWLQENRLEHLPAGLFAGLERLVILKLDHNRLRELSKGIFDNVLHSLGDWYGSYRHRVRGELSLDTDLKGALAFHSNQQWASEGAIVTARVNLSRSLPVSVRVPYSMGGSANVDDYKDLTPSPSEGLLFLAGETSKEITFTLAESGDNRDKTVVLTLADLPEIRLRRSDGTGPEAPHLKANSFLKSSNEGATHTVTIVPPGSNPDDPVPVPGRGIFVPVILTSAGLNNSSFTSELTLTNRGAAEAILHYTYTAHAGGGNGTASDTLVPGRQRIQPDAIGYLKKLGIPIPGSGNRIGTLRVEEVSGSTEVGVMVRTTTAVPEGRAGLAYPGIPGEEGFREEGVYLCGLRQNQQDRSNVAFQNMGGSEDGSITVRTTVFSGDPAHTLSWLLEDQTLGPGEFHQYTAVLKVLGSAANGYVKVERVEGTAPFYAYGVINDQANSDGSFVFPVSETSLAGATGQVLPVVVERAPFTSELTVTNFSNEEKAVTFSVVADAIETEDHTATFPLELKAGEQHIIPNVIDWARQRTSGVELPSGLASALFAEVENGDMSGIVIGARTGSQGNVGRYGVFYNAVPFGQSFTTVTWVDALQQNDENRSNLALVNTGEVDDTPSEFNLEIYNGDTGRLANTATGFRVPARRWYQIDGILAKYGIGTTQGYVRIEKISGNNPFLAYGVINDGGARLQRSDDGAYLPARE